MKKITTKRQAVMSNAFYKKILLNFLLYSLLLPLLIKVFLDIPIGIADYVCNSYEGVYPLAARAGLVCVQIVSVLADVLRAGFVGCVLSCLLYFIGRGARGMHMLSGFLMALICPIAVTGVGMGLNYACVSVGISRDSLTLFKAKLPQLYLAASIEYILYGVLLICAALLMLRTMQKHPKTLFEDAGGFFPSSALFKTVTVSISLFGIISLLMTLSDMIIDLKTYTGITEHLEGIMGYLVLPYLYLILKLASMLMFSAFMVRRLERKWQACGEANK